MLSNERKEFPEKPEKVHISESLFTILEELGGYEMEKRGTVMVKGKGDCVTYWLLGKSSKARFNHLEIM
uniref:Guanylate cyclase domain-containing protein n=1 Tax=Romanomermis culicivorax TaxID=13658 RepID=A0A915HQP9_ROMCU